MKSAYAALKKLIKRHVGEDPDTELALERHEEKPDVWRGPLEDALNSAGVDGDQEVVAAAQRLMGLVDPDGAQAGKYVITTHGPVYGQTIGDKNIVTQHYGAMGGGEGGPKAP